MVAKSGHYHSIVQWLTLLLPVKFLDRRCRAIKLADLLHCEFHFLGYAHGQFWVCGVTLCLDETGNNWRLVLSQRLFWLVIARAQIQLPLSSKDVIFGFLILDLLLFDLEDLVGLDGRSKVQLSFASG